MNQITESFLFWVYAATCIIVACGAVVFVSNGFDVLRVFGSALLIVVVVTGLHCWAIGDDPRGWLSYRRGRS